MRLIPSVVALCALACGQAPDTNRTASMADTARSVGAGATAAPIAAPAQANVQTAADSSVKFDADFHPVLPLTFANACQGEDCITRFPGTVCAATKLLAAAVDSAPVITTLVAGDSVEVLRRDLRVPSVGVVVLRKDFVLDYDIDMETDAKMARPDTVRFARGDTVYVLRYVALGAWLWAYRGVVHSSSQFWAAAPGQSLGVVSARSSVAAASSNPVVEDWWYAKPRAGTAGWWHADEAAGQCSPES
jgi:hypothetical protein